LPIVLHSPLNTYHRPCRLQPTDTHTPLHIRREHLILKSTNRLLERLTLLFKPPVSVDFRLERAITELPEGLVYSVKAHVVGVEESKDVSGDERGRDVDVNDRHGMNLAVICRPVKGESPFYKRVRGVEVGADVTRRRFTAMLVPDVEWNEGRASIVLETGRDWR
jgi:hypothetical protein